MWPRSGAAVTVLALLCGVWAAPYTHAHRALDSGAGGHHPHGRTLIHTHASPHAHHDAGRPDADPAGHPDEADRIWSVDSFVLRQPVPSQAPAPVLMVHGEPPVQLTSACLSAHPPQPKAHGPPIGSPSGLRAPPAFPPAFV
jgi:hypothetical protein